MPVAIRSQLEDAAIAGFHDTIFLLIAVSLLGLALASLLKNR
jgi:hypothetical protein